MVRFTSGGQYLLATSQGRKRELLYDLRTEAELPVPSETSDMLAVSPDGRTLAAPTSQYAVKFFDLPAMRERAVLKGHRWSIYCTAFSPDGQVFATGGGDAVTRLWDVATGRELTQPLRGHLQGVTALAFSPDGKALATGSTDHTVKLWHVATGRELLSVAEAEQPAFSPDGNTLLLRVAKGVRLLHVPTLAEIDSNNEADRMAEN
jgi:WD40 repeat protein